MGCRPSKTTDIANLKKKLKEAEVKVNEALANEVNSTMHAAWFGLLCAAEKYLLYKQFKQSWHQFAHMVNLTMTPKVPHADRDPALKSTKLTDTELTDTELTDTELTDTELTDTESTAQESKSPPGRAIAQYTGSPLPASHISCIA
jgi:hypothetical protein